jgi:hypothetical protein
MIRIEAVTACRGYGDILEHSIQHNQSLFDRWIIVTAPDDDATHRVCKKHGIDFVDTDAFTRKGEQFNKGLGINVGLAHLTCGDWMLHLDVDVLLPPRTRHFLENAELDTKNLYGIDRFNLVGWNAYQESKQKSSPQYEWFCLINPPAGCSFGSRIVHYDYGGYMPIGFFQLWHADSGVTRYPTKASVNAEHTDVLHAMKWPRARRVLIPEILAVHLESEKMPFGAGWKGRVSKPFGPGERSHCPDPAPYSPSC